ncbi:hypothetical protein C7405_1323 [Paraburkholderia caballeronis]|uniref:MNIO family bufferin maturase n=1 Tax=Paraburkholderia caballeronis TaxID=416943 RepID=UPI001064AC3A|nr:DUF692 domain-containing protein [Paraburkholderia caballeronis]TDV23308.1 hypothetical protein C7405_1323 [Paraburkholderia caballeronis]
MKNPTAPGAGLGLKPAHYDEALRCDGHHARGLWFEVHPENYMVEGGPRLAWLDAIRAHFPLSLHGVSLSLAADSAPDPAQLARLKALADRVEPALVSEHLAWSAWRGQYHPDLLPFPRTHAALARVAENVQRTQHALGRRIAIENPSHYLRMDGHDWGETDFLVELTRRTGCGLLLDVNNVYVGAHNVGFDAHAYVDAIPADAIVEIHLAGHSVDANTEPPLLVDTHDAAIAGGVWALYRRVIARIGARPTLIERDDNLPAFDVLLCERDVAQTILDRAAMPGFIVENAA